MNELDRLKQKTDKLKTTLAIHRKEKDDLEKELKEHGIIDFSDLDTEVKTMAKKLETLKKRRDKLYTQIEDGLKKYENS